MTASKPRISNKLRRETSMAKVESAACRLFVERGYRSTSIDMIAKEVGLTKGAVYFYYKDKQSLLQKLLNDSEGQLFNPIYAASAETVGAHEQINLFLNLLGRAGATIDRYLLLLPVLMAAEFKGSADATESLVNEMYTRVYDHIIKVIKKGQQSGDFTNHQNPRALATIIVSLSNGLLLEMYRTKNEVAGADLAKAANQAMLSMLESPVTSSVK